MRKYQNNYKKCPVCNTSQKAYISNCNKCGYRYKDVFIVNYLNV